MFLSVPGAFDLSFGKEHRHPLVTLAIVVGAIVGLVLLGRFFWRQVKKLWAQAREGGVILSTPGRYLSRVFLPSFLGWLCRAAVTGIFLAAFAIPVTFNSIMWVFGSGSLANVASFTPARSESRKPPTRSRSSTAATSRTARRSTTRPHSS